MLGVDRDILDVVLAGTRQRAVWFDPKNDEAYIWIVLDGALLDVVDHHVEDGTSVFIANTVVTNEYRPVRHPRHAGDRFLLQAPESVHPHSGAHWLKWV